MHALEHAKDTLCRNVTIYGRCRYEDKGGLIYLYICCAGADPRFTRLCVQSRSDEATVGANASRGVSSNMSWWPAHILNTGQTAASRSGSMWIRQRSCLLLCPIMAPPSNSAVGPCRPRLSTLRRLLPRSSIRVGDNCLFAYLKAQCSNSD